MNEALTTILEKGNIQDSKDLLFSHIEKTHILETDLLALLERIKHLEGIAKITIQKTGVVRFNPFGDFGGNQSFTIALLDNENSGFVISSIFVKEGSRVYAKQITKGVSDHALSNEEQEAIFKATGNEATTKKPKALRKPRTTKVKTNKKSLS